MPKTCSVSPFQMHNGLVILAVLWPWKRAALCKMSEMTLLKRPLLTHNSIHLHKDQNGNSSPVEIRFQCHGSGKDISRPSSFHFSLSRCEDRDYNFSLKRSSSFCISQRALLWMMRGNFEFSHYALTKEPSKRPTDDITTCIHKMTSNFNIQPWICSSWKFLEIDWDKRTRIFTCGLKNRKY